jgi:hypothetical protein
VQALQQLDVVEALAVAGKLADQPEEALQEERADQGGIGVRGARGHALVDRSQQPRGAGSVTAELGKRELEQAGPGPGVDDAGGGARPQALEELVVEPRSGHRADRVAIALDRGRGVGLDHEAESDGVLERPHHPHRVLLEAEVRVADGPDDARVEVVDAADVVDHREVRDVVEQRVDGEVSTPRVLLRGAPGLRHLRQRRPGRLVGVGLHRLVLGLFPVVGAFRRLRARAEGSDLDDGIAEEDVNQPEAASDRARVAEQVPNFPRAGVGRQVEVLRRAAEHEVADAASNEVREVPGLLEAVQDLERLPRDAAA